MNTRLGTPDTVLLKYVHTILKEIEMQRLLVVKI
jgi:hypothetical protein